MIYIVPSIVKYLNVKYGNQTFPYIINKIFLWPIILEANILD